MPPSLFGALPPANYGCRTIVGMSGLHTDPFGRAYSSMFRSSRATTRKREFNASSEPSGPNCAGRTTRVSTSYPSARLRGMDIVRSIPNSSTGRGERRHLNRFGRAPAISFLGLDLAAQCLPRYRQQLRAWRGRCEGAYCRL